MDDATRPDHDLPTGPDQPVCSLDTLVRLEQERAVQIQELREELATLRDSLAEEVRTKSVRVTDDRGFDRVHVTADRQTARVAVHARGAVADTTCLELVAQVGSSETPEYLALAFTNSGNVVGGVEMLEGEKPRSLPTSVLGRHCPGKQLRTRIGAEQVRGAPCSCEHYPPRFGAFWLGSRCAAPSDLHGRPSINRRANSRERSRAAPTCGQCPARLRELPDQPRCRAVLREPQGTAGMT